LTISSTIPNILQDLRIYYSKHGEGKKLISDLVSLENPIPHYTFKEGLLFCKDIIYVLDLPNRRQSIISEFHNSPIAGHSGAKPTHWRLVASFLWPGGHKEIKEWVKNCSTCQQKRYLPTKKQELFQPLNTPQQVWEKLTMEFITHLPNSFDNTAVWVVCDRLTKFVHFISFPTKYNAKDLAIWFSTEINRLHGIPYSIIFDRDPLFLSNY